MGMQIRSGLDQRHESRAVESCRRLGEMDGARFKS